MASEEFTLLGDALWLDFVNSARGRIPSPPDLLPDAAAFARWSELHHLDAAGDTNGGAPRSRGRSSCGPGSPIWPRPCTTAASRPAGSIAAVNELLGRSGGSQQLTRVAGEWRLRFAPSQPLAVLEAIARSAAATLAEPGIAVRRCAGEGCSLFFTDQSPMGSRLWCDPAACGQDSRIERRRRLPR